MTYTEKVAFLKEIKRSFDNLKGIDNDTVFEHLLETYGTMAVAEEGRKLADEIACTTNIDDLDAITKGLVVAQKRIKDEMHRRVAAYESTNDHALGMCLAVNMIEGLKLEVEADREKASYYYDYSGDTLDANGEQIRSFSNVDNLDCEVF